MAPLIEPLRGLLDSFFVAVPGSTNLEVRTARLVARDGMKDFFISSSLSDGLRGPSSIFFTGDIPRAELDIADGSSAGRALSRSDFEELLVVVLSCDNRGLEISRLLVLCSGSGLLVNSELLPVPRMITGLSRSRKKSSISVLVVLVTLLLRVEGVRTKLSVVVAALGDLPMLDPLAALPCRPLAACLPYPSCPVPATGPRRWSFFSGFAAGAAGSVLARLEKKPNSDVLLGLGAGAGTGVGSVRERCFSN